MSRTANIMNRIELVAKKLEMDIEKVIDILEGKHPTLHVATKPVESQSLPNESTSVGAASTSNAAGVVNSTTNLTSASPNAASDTSIAANGVTTTQGAVVITGETDPKEIGVGSVSDALENEEAASGAAGN